jgi:predicted ATP-grasp superfamily ATP-dependent carboligase
MYPLDFGDSSYLTTVPIKNVASAIATLKKLLPEIKYRGIFSAEFKLDERDDTFKLIEVNTRPWTYIGFDTAHGMNMAEMAYRDALEENVPTVTDYDIGASMVYMPNDLMACLSLIRRGELSFFAWLRSWLRARSAIFLWNDPMPAVVWWWGKIAGKVVSLFAEKKSRR